MKRLAHRRPSPATAIACLALFVSLGGTSYGLATGFIDTREIKNNTIRTEDVRTNSLRTQDIRDSEVRGRDIRNSTVTGIDVALNGLTGADIVESSLTGKVPQADTVDGIDSTGFVRADDTGFVGIPLAAGGTFAPGEPEPDVDVDPLGYAHLQGVIAVSATPGPLATLPVGARPMAIRRFVVFNDSGNPKPAFVSIQPDGTVASASTVTPGDRVSLDGVTFRVSG